MQRSVFESQEPLHFHLHGLLSVAIRLGLFVVIMFVFLQNLAIGASAITISTSSPIPDGLINLSYSGITLTASGGTGTGYTWASVSGAPAGMSVSAAGVISGTPTSAGTGTWNIKVTDSGSNTVTKGFAYTIASLTSVALSCSPSPACLTLAQGGTVQFTATGTFSDGEMANVTNLVVGSGSTLSLGAAANNQTSGAASTVMINASSPSPLTVTAGQDLVLVCRDSAANTTFTVTDSASQTWTQIAGSPLYANAATLAEFTVLNSAAITSITVTAGSGAGLLSCVLVPINNAATSSAIDGTPATATNGTGTTSSLTSGSLTTSNANDVLLYALGAVSQTSYTAASPFTIPTGATDSHLAVSTEIVSSAQTALTTSMSWPASSYNVGAILLAIKGGATTGGWSVTNQSVSNVAAVNSSGLVSAQNAGTATIQACVSSICGTASVKVNAPADTSITISPTSALVATGDSQQFTATGNPHGDNLTNSAAWAVSPSTCGTISASGLFTAGGIACGASITATYNGIGCSSSGGACGSVTVGAASSASTVSWNTTHQTIDGFGVSDHAMLIAEGINLSTAQADLFFNDSTGNGYSILRIGTPEDGSCTSISATCATGNGTGDSVSDMQLAQARGARIFASAWTPPAFMKTNGNIECTAGSGNGALSTGSYAAFAEYLSNFIASLSKYEGVNVYAISPSNEPDQCQSYDSALWTAAQLDTFIKTNLGPTLAANGQSGVRIVMPETSAYAIDTSYAGTCMGDAACAAYVGVNAFHGYDNSFSISNPYSAGFWQTEVSAGVGYGPSLCGGCWDPSITDAMMWANIIDYNIAVADENAWLYWSINIQDGTDNEGLLGPGGTPVSIRTYVIGNYAKFVRPGWVRIDATHAPQTGITVSAYKDPSGSGNFAIVATNQNSTNVNQTFDLSGFSTPTVIPWITSASLNLVQQSSIAAGSSFTYTLPAMSVTTFVRATPNIVSLGPASGPVGTSVTITGTNFGTTQGTSTVTFNGTAATPTSWSATSIVVPVPSGATTGNVVVTVGGVRQQRGEFHGVADAEHYHVVADLRPGGHLGDDYGDELRRDARHEHGHL